MGAGLSFFPRPPDTHIMTKPLQALPYYGGKSLLNHASGKWVSSLLPYQKDSLYCEPFCGMASILLNRPRSNSEIINDLNDRLVNWWLCVRDMGDELDDKLDHTPWSETLYNHAFDTLDEGEPLDRAVKYTIVILCSVMHADGNKGFAAVYDPIGTRGSAMMRRYIKPLRDRMRDVQILNRPAVKVLRRIEDMDNAIIYCDPPYRTSDTSSYAADQQDTDEMIDTLLKQKGRVAISGYNDEWDMLGWHRMEMPTHVRVLAKGEIQVNPRTEVLWCNFKPDMQEPLL